MTRNYLTDGDYSMLGRNDARYGEPFFYNGDWSSEHKESYIRAWNDEMNRLGSPERMINVGGQP